jgi:hypothetical protein
VATKRSWATVGAKSLESLALVMARRVLRVARVNQTMAADDQNDDFLAAVRQRAQRVLDHVQLDSVASARGAVLEMQHLSVEAEAEGHRELAETARDALAEAWRWRLGRDAMDARVRLARLVGQLVRDSAKAGRSRKKD